MTNAELIAALRRCSYTTVAGADREDGFCKPCAYFAEDTSDITCIDRMMIDAADALEKLQSDWQYCSNMLNIAIRTTGISMTALVKLYEIECADIERSKHNEQADS